MFVQKLFINVSQVIEDVMKKIKKQKQIIGKYKHRIKEINSDVINSKSFLPFDMDFIWEYPTNNIFKAANEKPFSRSAKGKK